MLIPCSNGQSVQCQFVSFLAVCCCFVMGALALSNGTAALGLPNSTAAPASVRIGALLALGTTVGQLAKEAIHLAVQDFNSANGSLDGTRLVLEIFDSGCSPVQGAASAVELMKKEVVAVVGPQSSAVSQFVSHLGNGAQVPFVSFAATDPNLSQMQYPYFIRIAPSDVMQMEAVAAFIAYHKWREVVAVYMDDDYGANGVSALSGSLQIRGSKIVQKVPLVPWIDEVGIDNELTSLANMQTRVFVLHLHPDMAFQILRGARFLHMLDIGYVWIATDLITSSLENTSLPSQVVESTQGIIGIRRSFSVSPQLKKLAMELGYMDLTQINAYGIYAYDAVWTIGHAVSAYVKQKNTFNFTQPSKLPIGSGGDCDLTHIQIFQGGAIMRDIILKTSFLGISGPVHFNKVGDIKDAAFEFVNMVGKSPHVVGYWANKTGVSRTHNQKFDSANPPKLPIIWPGATTDIPKGWVIPKNGRPLKIGVPRKAGYTDLVSETTGPNNVSIYNGFCIQVFEAALKYLPYAVPHYYVSLGNGSSTPEYNDLIKNLANQEYDAVVGDVVILPERLKIVDFTQPYIESGLVVLVPLKDNRVENPWAFLRPFTSKMWCTVLGFFLFTGTVIWMLEYRVNEDFQGSPRKQAIVVLSFIFSTLFFSHKEDTRSFLGRIVLLVWLFVILIINSSYTASLTSILTVEQLGPTIQGLDSLLQTNMPIGYQTGSFVRNYLINLGANPARLKDLSSPEMYKKALDTGPRRGGVAAIVDELPYVQLFRAANCKNYSIVGQEFTKSGWGFAFPRGSEITPDLSKAILQMSQTGELAKIREYWFNERACEQKSTAAVQSSQLDLNSFWGLFLVSGLASMMCLTVHIVRLLILYRQQQQVEGGSSPSASHYMNHIKQFAEFAAKPKMRKEPTNPRIHRDEGYPSYSTIATTATPTIASAHPVLPLD